MDYKMKIALVHTRKAYLPEVDIYKNYFTSLGYNLDIKDLDDDLNCYDVLWYFMGKEGKRYNNDQFIIHEYASLSTGRFSKLKDRIKKAILPKPDLRVFLSEELKKEMNFRDSVPFEIRDMGVDKQFFHNLKSDKKYDIVYVGAIENRNLNVALDLLFSYQKNIEILVVGEVTEEFKNKYSQVTFTGKVDYSRVPKYISLAKSCLNWVPNIYPYNIQTSTKYIEYFAMGMPIISNRYKWVDNYSKKMDIKFIDILDKDRVIELINSDVHISYTSKPDTWDIILNKVNFKKYFY